MRGGRARTNIDDDVRSSLDLLDGVIGEFDDGLTSSAESEAPRPRHPLAGGADHRGSCLSINDQIDDIFSQLTEEIYTEEKKEATAGRPVRRSPTRNRFDPLPIPPSTATHPPPIDRRKKPGAGHRSPSAGRRERPGGPGRPRPGRNSSLPAKTGRGAAEGEVVLYGDRGGERRTLERVTAEVHKVRGGQQPPPKPEKQKIHLKPGTAGERRGAARSRSRSGQQREVTREERAVIQELRQRVGGTQGKLSKFDDGNRRTASHVKVPQSPGRRGRRNDDDLTVQSLEGRRAGPGPRGSPASSGSRGSGGRPEPQEAAPGRGKAGSADRRGRDSYSRSRSLGPLEAGEARRGPPPRREESVQGRGRSKSRGRGEEPGRPRGPGETLGSRPRSRGRSPTRPPEHDRRRGSKPPSPEEAQAIIDQMLPRYPHVMPPERQRSMVDLRVGDDFKVNQRRSMAVGPYEDLPPHLRNHLMPPGITQVPAHIDEQLRFQHQMNIEAQRELLRDRGFPGSHPLVSGEIPLHPELLGQLHFDVPARTTLPLGPEDYRRFLPEQRRAGMQTTFPPETDGKVQRQQSRRDGPYNRESSFVSLPFEDQIQRKKNSRSKSTDSGDTKTKPFSLFQGGPARQNVKRAEVEGRPSQHDQQWFMKERHDLKSLPSLPPDSTDNKLSRSDQKRSSFGMILKDKFQRNPNMYFPDTQTPPKRAETKLSKSDSLSDTDTLIHNMSEGSFDKSSNNSHSIGSNKSSCSSGKSSACSHDSMNGSPRMRRKQESITTPTEPKPTALLLPSNPSVILNKKTIRNYTPTESTNMLRQLEGHRQHSLDRHGRGQQVESNLARKSSMDQLIEDFHNNLPPPPPVIRNAETSLPFSDGDSLFSGSHAEHSLNLADTTGQGERPFQAGTVTSQTSNWSVASSAASFDYMSVNSIDKRRNRRREPATLPSLAEGESPKGVRVPPEGAPSPEPPVQKGKERSAREAQRPPAQLKGTSNKDAVADLLKSAENDDELSMLHKLISEGRISGMNEKPPLFTPPTPPSKPPTKPRALSQARASSSGPPKANSQLATKSGDRPRKSRDAPKPPTHDIKPPPATNEIKFISGRRINSEESVNDAGDGSWHRRPPKKEARSEGVQRSTSMHNTRGEAPGELSTVSVFSDNNSKEESSQEAALAQLIADSTEKKFKLNSLFKGMWKKKHYSFDLS